MAGWKLAPSLAALFAEINVKWPNRDRTTDGTIGDAAHSARVSQHNPNRDPDDTVPDGMVTAIDVDKDGINVDTLLKAVIGDRRVWYVIWDRHIYSRTNDWRKIPYNGSNPHTSHVHVSLRQTKEACTDIGSWGLVVPVKPPVKETAVARLTRIAAQRMKKIRNLQRRLRRR